MEKITFDAGRYYIGDPCYVVTDDEEWEEIGAQTGWFGSEPFAGYDENLFLKKGKECWAESTAWGDGCYQGSDGGEYWVDAGLIGIVPVEAIDDDVPDFRGGYAYHTFDKPFEVWYNDGVFHFGDITIDTN